jgi:hypothetical protein
MTDAYYETYCYYQTAHETSSPSSSDSSIDAERQTKIQRLAQLRAKR